MRLPEVVITGMGAITPLGQDFPSSYASLLAGVSGVQAAPADILASFPEAIAASVPPGFDAALSHADRTTDRATQLALIAAREAVQQARLELDEAQRARAGVYCGIGLGGASTLNTTYTRYYKRLFKAEAGNPLSVHPLTVPILMANAAASQMSIYLGLSGPTSTYSIACASSAVALGEAYRAIRHGYADLIVVIGTEAQLCLGPYIGWNAMRVMAPPDPEDVRASCKPFSRDRKGFVLGEGAAAMVLESAEHAKRRGAAVLARLAGYGTSSDATHITQPSAPGQARALRAALEDAGIAPSEVGYINAHGTATTLGDISETRAIREVFGSHAERVAISATKSMHGHLIGAGGALEFAIAVQAMRSGSIPPTAHLTHPDPECDLDYVPCEARHGRRMSAVVSNSFAFGGTNASLVACADHS